MSLTRPVRWLGRVLYVLTLRHRRVSCLMTEV